MPILKIIVTRLGDFALSVVILTGVTLAISNIMQAAQ